MFQSLSVFQASSNMAKHSAQRQSLIAENIANADTPNYKAKRMAPFAELYTPAPSGKMKTTRAAHVAAAKAQGQAPSFEADTQSSPNGNSVSLEDEMMQSVSINSEHRRAIQIYKHALDVLRSVTLR